MSERSDQALLSVSPHYAKLILSGQKTVELRRRKPNLSPITRVWLYATKPEASVICSLSVTAIDRMDIETLWQIHGVAASINREAFDRYFDGLAVGYALKLRDILPLDHAISLADLRKVSPAFHPPQFYSRVLNGSAAYDLLNRLAA